MNIQWLARTLPIALLAATFQFALAKDISYNDLTPAARRVADTEIKTATVKRVEGVKHQGRDIYAITLLKPDGSPKYIFLNLDGTYVRDVPTGPSWGSQTMSTTSKDVNLSKLPEPVRKTIQTETKNGPVSRVTQVGEADKPVYEIAFRQANGQEKLIYLNPDGSYAQKRSWDALENSVSPSATRGAVAGQKNINFNELPTAVQNAFHAQAGASRVEHLQAGQLNGQPVYHGRITKNGQKVDVLLDANGKALSNSAIK